MVDQKRKLSLIPNWKRAWKFGSVWVNTVGLFAMGIGEALSSSWFELPEDIRHHIPNATTIGIFLFVFGIIARITQFTQKESSSESNSE